MTVERHLILRELILLPSGEWQPNQHGWCMVRIMEGVGYCLHQGAARQLNPGDCLTAVFNGKTLLRASQLGPWKLQCFPVDPQFISGLLTVMEVHQLESAMEKSAETLIVHPADSKIARAFAAVAGQSQTCDLQKRCQLLSVWAEAVAGLLVPKESAAAGSGGLRARLQESVGQISEAELITCSLGDLARQLHCSERHFGRLFRETFGVSFRQRQIELRLLRARQLLANSSGKIIHVAYDCGYRHLGLFNTMFKRRFGLTPSAWRLKAQKNSSSGKPRPGRPGVAAAVLAMLLFGTAARAETPPPAAPESKFILGREAAPEEIRRAREALHRKFQQLDFLEKRSSTNAPVNAGTNAATFVVNGYQVTGNTLLPESGIEALLDRYTGLAVNFETIRKALADLQTAYRERGFVTVSVSLPPQKLTNGIVQVAVVEGRLAEINVLNNRYFSSNNVMRALPSLHTNWMLNSIVLQRELDAANANRDRQIFPKIGPGPEPGTSTLDLKVKDRLPLHARVELNNQSTPGTPDLRANLNAQYNNLWDREHQLGVQYGFTPEQFKSDLRNSATALDDPLVANYSGYYRFPIGSPEAVAEQPDHLPAHFGYNEATHQFQLPPATGRPEIIFYASRSTVDTGVKNGATSVAVGGSSTNLLTVTSHDSSEDLTLNENLGARFSKPFAGDDGVRGAFSFGLDFKRYRKASFATNNFDINITILDPVDNSVVFQTNEFKALPSPASYNAVDYLPLNLGLDLSIDDKLGTSFLSLALNFNYLPIFSGNGAFQSAANTTKTDARYSTITASYARNQKIYKDWDILLRANAQLANEPLISNEQFALGGTTSVRGYHEGEVYGDSGWRVSFEQRTPFLSLGSIVDNHRSVPIWLRASAFMDYGEAYLKMAPAGASDRTQLWGAGFGATASIGDFLDARLTLAWPLLGSATTRAGEMGVFFSLGAQF